MADVTHFKKRREITNIRKEINAFQRTKKLEVVIATKNRRMLPVKNKKSLKRPT